MIIAVDLDVKNQTEHLLNLLHILREGDIIGGGLSISSLYQLNYTRAQIYAFLAHKART